MATLYRDMSPEWREHLKPWADEFGPDLPVQQYEHDGKPDPNVWIPGPHLAVTEDPALLGGKQGQCIAWPVDYDGWANPRDIDWSGVLELLKAGKRTP